MKRIVTAAVGLPLALAAIFALPGPWFFLALLLLLEVGVLEYAGLVERSASGAPTKGLLVLVPLAAVALSPGLWPPSLPVVTTELVAIFVMAIVLAVGLLVLLARVPVEQGLTSLGAMAFGIPYFALPLASLSQLQQSDPWALVLLLAVVWAGDTAAFYCGRRWGRRRLAPRISPRKTWEGAGANVLASLSVAAVWSLWRLGRLEPWMLLLALVLSVAGQLGDLVESMMKRGAGVKDSGWLLPGHGGVMDRLDAMLFAAPVMLLAVRLLGAEGFRP